MKYPVPTVQEEVEATRLRAITARLEAQAYGAYLDEVRLSRTPSVVQLAKLKALEVEADAAEKTAEHFKASFG